MFRCSAVAFASLLTAVLSAPCSAQQDSLAESPPASKSIHEIVMADQPVALWSFSKADLLADGSVRSTGSAREALLARSSGGTLTTIAGPLPDEFPLFRDSNAAKEIGPQKFLRVADPGDSSILDFDQGDQITIEAWVSPTTFKGGGYAYILGKGRTHLPGQARENHNYAFRLASKGGSAAISFLFRSRGEEADWHRWTSSSTFTVNDGWHHVAVTYAFGSPDSLQGYIDGAPVKGKWDMGGKTDRAPVIDDDELWIGSAMGGSPSSTLLGGIDEVALYRTALPAERIAARYRYSIPELVIDESNVPEDQIRVDVFEGIPNSKTWKFRRPRFLESFAADVMAWTELPKKYDERGVQADRGNPFLIRAMTRIAIPAGSRRIAVRSRNASRLYVDGELIGETDFHGIPSSGHGQVTPLDTSLGEMFRPVPRGCTQTVIEWESDGKPHVFRFEMIVGGRNHRPEMGETCVAVSTDDDTEYELLAPGPDKRFGLTDQRWEEFLLAERTALRTLNLERRIAAAADELAYWKQRHDSAREWLKRNGQSLPNELISGSASDTVDAIIQQQLDDAGLEPQALIDDASFLRRLSLDVLGVIPPAELVAEFAADQRIDRRERLVDRLLQQPEWADHWVGYWQDVLAENPNIVNPTLNNTGPFRWWIYESFLENKAMDRFATELIMMEGSQRYGGPAGFAVATENDVPMAAKAHIVGQAFLGLEMKCARCHDAPFHDFRQRDLFSLAAMLNRGPQSVPASSSIPGGDAVVASLLVEVTLKPGEKVAPEWTFEDLMSGEIPKETLRRSNDSREQLAALITSPSNRRFAQVVVNRLWSRYLGRGFVDPVDDWQDASPSHPLLLEFLADELIANDYDLKHVARIILNSKTYQRESVEPDAGSDERPFLFAGPAQRRMTAEQLLDSLFIAADRPMDAGRMCIDIDGSRAEKQSIDLGIARRAWHFTSLSNERDRPSLAMPFAQPYVTLLETFGWRSSRQNPVTARNAEATVRQPAAMANGLVSRDVVRLSDRNSWTRIVRDSESVDGLIRSTYRQVLSREPSVNELAVFSELLKDGFDDRIVSGLENPGTESSKRLRRGWISWSNHLNPEASRVKAELEAAVRRGTPPTQTIDSDYRERVEDMVWVLLNSPEFVFVP